MCTIIECECLCVLKIRVFSQKMVQVRRKRSILVPHPLPLPYRTKCPNSNKPHTGLKNCQKCSKNTKFSTFCRYHQQMMMMRSQGGVVGHVPPDPYHQLPPGYDPHFSPRHQYPPRHRPPTSHPSQDGYPGWHHHPQVGFQDACVFYVLNLCVP